MLHDGCFMDSMSVHTFFFNVFLVRSDACGIPTFLGDVL